MALLQKVIVGAEFLKLAITRSDGDMLGGPEIAALLELAYNIEMAMDAYTTDDLSMVEIAQLIQDLFVVLVDRIRDARLAYLGVSDLQYYTLLAVYSIVERVIPFAQANICSHGDHPLIVETWRRWNHLADQLFYYQATQDESYLSQFVMHLLADHGSWSSFGEPSDDVYSVYPNTFCIIGDIYNSAYTAGADSLYYTEPSLELEGCPVTPIDLVVDCGL